MCVCVCVCVCMCVYVVWCGVGVWYGVCVCVFQPFWLHDLTVFSVGLPVKILKTFLPSSFLTTQPVLLSILDFITLFILGERYKL